MSKTKTFTAWSTRAVVALLILIASVLSACGGPAAAPTEPPAPTEVSAAPTSIPTEPPTPTEVSTEPPPTEPPTPTEVPTEPPPTDTPVPTEEPPPEVVDDTACIGCHTDEETLKAVAEEEEPAESLSEGEG